MHKPIPPKYLWLAYIAIAVLSLRLILLVVDLSNQEEYVADWQARHGRGVRTSGLKLHRMMTAADAVLIQSWMSFDYIARVFGIPIFQLQTALRIEDSDFSRMTIGKYAKENGLDALDVTQRVVTVVRNYLLDKATEVK